VNLSHAHTSLGLVAERTRHGTEGVHGRRHGTRAYRLASTHATRRRQTRRRHHSPTTYPARVTHGSWRCHLVVHTPRRSHRRAGYHLVRSRCGCIAPCRVIASVRRCSGRAACFRQPTCAVVLQRARHESWTSPIATNSTSLRSRTSALHRLSLPRRPRRYDVRWKLGCR
jgi:hypothetical protein